TIQGAVGGKLHQFAGDLRLSEKIHRRVGMRPVAHDPQPHELLSLHVEPVLGVCAAFMPECDHGAGIGQVRFRLVPGAVVLFSDLPFDRKPMTVPSRHVVGIEPQHLLATRDHVLENLVQRMPDMDVAVRVGRPVVENELLASFRRRAELRVKIIFLPARQDLRLALRQAGAHGKVSLRQKQRFRIISLGLGHTRFLAGRFECGKAGISSRASDRYTCPRTGNASPARLSESRAWATSAAMCPLSVSMDSNFCSWRIHPINATSMVFPERSPSKSTKKTSSKG